MNDNVSAEQVKILRGEFETYLRKRNPHWSNFTVIIVNSDAFFALNNPVDVDFWSVDLHFKCNMSNRRWFVR